MKRLAPAGMAAPLARYAHAVEIETPGRMVFVSGQLALARDGSIPEGASAQSDLVFANLKTILAEAGMGPGDVVRINAYLVDRADLTAYMAARDRFVGASAPPASTLLLVAGFTRPEFKVEIELVAAKAG